MTSRTGKRKRWGCSSLSRYGSLHGSDESPTGGIALETPKILRCDNHNLIAAMNGDMLRPFRARAPYQLAETRFCILQAPAPRSPIPRPLTRFRELCNAGFQDSGHTDHNITSRWTLASWSGLGRAFVLAISEISMKASARTPTCRSRVTGGVGSRAELAVLASQAVRGRANLAIQVGLSDLDSVTSRPLG